MQGNLLGSIVYGGVQIANAVTHKDDMSVGRKMLDTLHPTPIPSVLDPTRTGYLGSGSKEVQASLHACPPPLKVVML
jgi:hypothetical protein